MVDPRARVCVPVEVEMIPLYREPAWSVRLRRAQRRERRHERRTEAARFGRLIVGRAVRAGTALARQL